MVRVRRSQAAAGSSRKRGLLHITGKQRVEERPVKKSKIVADHIAENDAESEDDQNENEVYGMEDDSNDYRQGAAQKGKHFTKEENCRTYSSPSLLVVAISKLNPMQRKAVEDIGFGGLLSISISMVPNDLLGWLLRQFKPLSRIVECKKRNLLYEVGWADVRDIFLLPHNRSQPVLELKKSDPLLDIRKRWKRDYGIPSVGRVPLPLLLDKMLQLKDGGDDFKRMFVLYALSAFLTPLSIKTVKFSTLKSLLKVDEIKNLDWCEYVIEHLCEAIHSWKEARNNKKPVGGCLLLLQISYLHRHSWRGKLIPRSLPLSQHWNDDNIEARIDEERESGGFGLGIFKLEGYPISKEEELKEEVQRTITYKLHRLFDDDAPWSSSILKIFIPIGEEFDRAVAKMNRDLAVICELRFTELESTMDQALSYNTSTSKGVASVLIRNIDTVIKEMQNIRCKLHARQCLEANAPNGPTKHNVDKDGSDSVDVDVDGSMKKVIVELSDTETDDDEVFSDGDGDDDQGARQCLKTSAPNGTARMSCENSKQKVIIELSDTEIDNDQVDGDPDPNAAGGATSNLIKVQPEAGQLAPHPPENDDVEGIGGAASNLIKVQPEEGQLTPHPQENDDVEGISVQKGTGTMSSKPNYDVLDLMKATSQGRFFTKLLCTYPIKMNNLQNYEAQIADFCISRSKGQATFRMFDDNRYTIANAQDFNSLELAKDISTFIITTWARLLNAAQSDPDKLSRFCLKPISAFHDLNIPTAILFKGWDFFVESCSRNVLSADLVFVPVHINAHFFLLVVNLKESLVQYLDNLRHEEDVAKEFQRAIEGVKNVVALFLEHHQHPEAKAVKEYELKTIQGKWRSSESDHDSGVYAMYHMDTFTGKSDDIDESPVMKADIRNELRAKFCARLILSPINTCTRSVLSGVSSFNNEKSNVKITY